MPDSTDDPRPAWVRVMDKTLFGADASEHRIPKEAQNGTSQ